tara:strand:+ start:1775 stop:2746 length:972 start_codon:yes stop_codon:yes gene_type:complete
MVVIACTPCLASTLGPAALSVATLVGLNGSKKKKRTMKGGGKKNKKKNDFSKKINKSCHDECEKVKKTFPTIMRKLGKQMGLDKKEIEKRIKEHNKHCESNCIKLMKDKDVIKDIIKAMKGGGELEMTQEDYEAMVREQNESMNEDRIRMIKHRQKEKERINLELRRRLIRQEDMRKECDMLVRLLESKGVSQKVAEDYAHKMFEQKLQCDSGKINACNYCKDEYLKNQRTSKKRSKTPQVPVQALPKSKSKSRSRPRRTRRRRKGPPESISMKLHAMGRTQRLKNLKKSLTKRSPPPPIRRSKSKSKSKLKKTKSTGGKRNK